jgi:hypothetical protein
MSLISKIYQAVIDQDLAQQFSTRDIRQWIIDKKIRKKDGSEYAESSIRSIGANSNLKNQPTSNKNIKLLQSKIIDGSVYYYFPE